MEHALPAAAVPRTAPHPYRRLVVASSFGTAIEWYDFFVYALVAPLVFDNVFFPRLDPLAGQIAVFSSFAVGFASRPLGGIFFGHFGDRIGRKAVLLATILTMGLSTTAIGVLPTYGRIGVWAPVLLVALRFLQGFALGGESIGALVLTVESAPAGRRGFYGSLIQAAGPLGIIGASGIVSALGALSSPDLQSWGWRVPFLLSFVLVLVGAWMRANIEESALFHAAAQRSAPARVPIAVVLRDWKRATLISLLVCLAETAFFYLTTIFAISYGTRTLGIHRTVLTSAFFMANCVALVSVPFFGALSDRFGRRPFLVLGLALAALYFSLFGLTRATDRLLVTAAIIAAAGFIHPLIFSAEASFIPELFGTEVRFTGASVGKQVGTVLGGGLAPLVATSLLGLGHGSRTPVVVYFLAMAVPAIAAALFARESARAPLDRP